MLRRLVRHRCGEFQYGKQIGNVATYIAGSALHEGGWRDLQSSDLYKFYGDVGWRGDAAKLHLNIVGADTQLNGPGTSPVRAAGCRSARAVHRAQPDRQQIQH